MACTIPGFESHLTLLGTSQTVLNKFTTTPRGIQELWERVCLVYLNFNEHECTMLYESMPRRIDIVLKSKGY